MGHPSWPVVIGGLASAGASGYRLAWGGRRAETNGYGGISYGMLCSGFTMLRRSGDTIGKLVDVLPDSK